MKIRFYNAKILCMPDNYDITDGELWVDDCKISYIGAKNITSTVFDRQIDCKGDLLMSGFVNAHTHSPMTFLRSLADDLPLQRWLNEVVFPIEKILAPEDAYQTAKIAVMEYLTSGITSIYDMYYLTEPVAEAIIDTGIRGALCGAVNDFAQSVDDLYTLYQKYNSLNTRLSMQLGFHAEYTTNKQNLQALSELAATLKAPVSAHLSETLAEVEDCKVRNNMTPPEYLDSLGLFNYGGTAFHCVHLSDNDIDILKRRNINAVINPSSNAKLASGVADIAKLIDNGINLSLGTDGAASNNALDMFREMYLAFALTNLKNNKPNSIAPTRILNMATKGGATSIGLKNNALCEGNLADIIRINLRLPNMQPLNNIVDNLVYSGSKSNVYMTMVNGKILYENGEFFIGEDPDTIYKRSNEIVKRLKTNISYY